MALQLRSPYLNHDTDWLRGNLHAHTTLSDGEWQPEVVIAAYERLGYDFLALSDHDLLVPPGDYQALTGITLIPADEVTSHGPHILAVQIQEVIVPHADRQEAIDSIREQGGFAVLNHPSWQRQFQHFSQALMEQLSGYAGIEIYNGVVERLEGSALALDRWDRLLGLGRQVWGYAHDDFHRPCDLARGWNRVQTTDRSVEGICEALRHGRFYASTGVDISHIRVEENTIAITAPNAQRIRFVGGWGRELDYADAEQAAYTVQGDEEGYVRVECYGEGARAAWTQPFFLIEA